MTLRDLDERWGQLVGAVQKEFSRQGHDPEAVFVPDRDLLTLRARVDGPGETAEWMSLLVTPGMLRAFDLDGVAREFVAHYRRRRETPHQDWI